MTQKNSIRIPEENKVFMLVPQDQLIEWTDNQQRILNILEKSNPNLPGIGDFIPKEEAERILGRKGTTLWKLRRDGVIASAKMGSEVFYSRKSIIEYLQKHLK